MRLIIDGLKSSTGSAETLAKFGVPLSELNMNALRTEGFSGSRVRSVNCMGWIWRQWLQEGAVAKIQERVSQFVDKGMEMQTASSLFYMRPHADLYLLHCAIFACESNQLEKLAERVVDSSGIGDHKPVDKGGELYASAWCGMLKHWILGDLKEAIRQSEMIWGAYRDASFTAATKPLVTPWLKGDWKAFVKAQQKDFEKLWARGRRDGTVRSEKHDEMVVTVERYPVEQKWCWAHCGLALLAHRRGVEVVTDPFWFPPHALKCLGVKQ